MSADKYLRFVDHGTSPSGKTRMWYVVSIIGDAHLGIVSWYAPWRRYVFNPADGTLYDANCLGALREFCYEQTTRHGEKKP